MELNRSGQRCKGAAGLLVWLRLIVLLPGPDVVVSTGSAVVAAALQIEPTNHVRALRSVVRERASIAHSTHSIYEIPTNNWIT